MANSENSDINIAQDSSPWKDDNLENSDRGNYKYPPPLPFLRKPHAYHRLLLQIQVPSASRPPEGAKARAQRPTLRRYPECYAPEGAYILPSSPGVEGGIWLIPTCSTCTRNTTNTEKTTTNSASLNSFYMASLRIEIYQYNGRYYVHSFKPIIKSHVEYSDLSIT